MPELFQPPQVGRDARIAGAQRIRLQKGRLRTRIVFVQERVDARFESRRKRIGLGMARRRGRSR